MIAVRCPKVTTGRGERLVSLRHVTGMSAVPGGWLLTVACPCGEEHAVAVARTPDEPVRATSRPVAA